ncbi:MAG: hypothetical protein HQL16_04475 [Candidatus Omnitrophica bacterium]|nr:hypothetical protein [Candidatus Omnitrophota bacterium]
MNTQTQHKLVFKHMVELPHCECVFCTTQEEETNRTKIFLVFKDRRRIYVRNGVKGNWEEVSSHERESVWEGFEQAVTSRKIPSFVTTAPELAAI